MARLDRLRFRLARPALTLLVPLALATAAYWRVLDGELQFDDSHTIERNLAVKDVGRFVRTRLADELAGGGRPLTDLTFALNYAVGGLVPWNFHLTNLALHLAAVVLVWAFTRAVLRLAGAGRAEWVAVAVAGLFALHPLQSQAVSYVSQRAEVLASALYVASLLLLLAAETRGRSWRGGVVWIAALAAFALALGAKAIAVTLPAAWLLLAAVVPAPEARARMLSWRRRAAAVAPFVLLDALYAGRTLLVLEKGVDAGFAVEGLSPPSYLLTELRAVAVYLRLLVWPAGQRVDWNFAYSRSLLEPAVLLSGLLLLVLAGGAVALAWWARRRSGEGGGAARVAAFGVLWFFLVLSPSSSVVPVADALVEHRVYLAAWGVFVATAVGVERWLARLRAWRWTAAAAALTLAWALPAAALHQRNAVWETRRALWADCVAKSPRNGRAWLSLGFAAYAEGKLEESVRSSLVALDLAGGDAAVELQAIRNLGAAYVALGRIAEAEAVLRRALDRGWWDADVLNNLASAVMGRGDLAEAEALARRAVAISPAKGHAWNMLGEVALRRDDLAGALGFFERSIEVDPDLAIARFNRGRTLARMGRIAEACSAWALTDAGAFPDLRLSLDQARAVYCARR